MTAPLEPTGSAARRPLLGGLALLFFLVHAGVHLRHLRPAEILWSCTVANALIGLGLIGGYRRPVAVGVSWLCYGNVSWLADVLTGGELLWSSILTHLGGLTVGLCGLRGQGFPPQTWLLATFGLLGLQLISRLATPPAANVNIAFAVYSGWERVYPSYRLFWLAMGLQATAGYFIAEKLLRRLLRPAHPATQPQELPRFVR